MIIIKDSSLRLVSINDMLWSCSRFIMALAIDGATRMFTLKALRLYLRPLLYLPSVVASSKFINGIKCGKSRSFSTYFKYSIMGDFPIFLAVILIGD